MQSGREIFSSRDTVLRGLIWCALVIGCFIVMHPYAGIVHDNVLYLGQALLRLNPEIYSGDAFFQWGSQDRYTLFSPLYAEFIAHFGQGPSTMVLLILGQALFLLASFAVVRLLIPAGLRGFSMLFVVCSVGLYGGFFLFRMAEPFVTPRIFVEAATLCAIALLVTGRTIPSLILIVASALLHPLLALAAFAYCWLYLLLEERRWAWLALLGVIPIAAGLAGIEPFTQLFQSFDDKWLAILAQDNGNVFLTQWRHHDWAMIVFDATVLFIGAQFARGVMRRALRAALLTAGVTLGATFIVADLLHNILLTSIQPWRALWIVHWMAAATVPYLVYRLWNEGLLARLAAGLVVFAFVTRGLPTSFAAALVAVALVQYRHHARISPWIVHGALVALIAGAFANWTTIASRVLLYASYDAVNPIAEFAVRALSKPFPLLVGAFALVWFGMTRGKRLIVPSVLAVLFLALTVSLWDQRSPFVTYVESAEPGNHPFSKVVRPEQEVLWHGNATAPWIMIQRKSYFSDTQRAGQVFNRQMALELNRRKDAIAVLSFQEDLCRLMNNLNRRNDSCEPSFEAIRDVCVEAKNLDFIVLETSIGNRWVSSWTWPVPVGGRRPYYYLYECKSLTRS